uniref:Uncharacterized protein n=1 Tax=viral metagenome TaxID=1070528 RepID=A0A6C0M2X8_9ZZZZ
MSHLNTYLQDKLTKYHKYNSRANELLGLLSSVSNELVSGQTNKLTNVMVVLDGGSIRDRLKSAREKLGSTGKSLTNKISSMKNKLSPGSKKASPAARSPKSPKSPKSTRSPKSQSPKSKRFFFTKGSKKTSSPGTQASSSGDIQEDLNAIVDIITEIQSINLQDIETGITNIMSNLKSTGDNSNTEIQKLQSQLADVKTQIGKIRTQAATTRTQLADKVQKTLQLM